MYTFDDFDIKVEETNLSNGVPIMLLYKKGAPVHTDIHFACGSRFDPAGKEGLAHFTEHMIVSGSKRFPSKDKMAIYIEQIGGIFGAGTSTDSLSIQIEVADREDFKHTVLLLREMLTGSLFEEKTIETERGSILKEIGDKLSNPSKQLWVLSDEVFFQGTPIEKPTLGTEKSVSGISRKDLCSFYEDLLSSGRAVIVVSGDIELGMVIRELEIGLPLRTSKKYVYDTNLPVIRNETVKVLKYPQQDHVHLLLGFRTAARNTPEIVPLGVLSTIFGGGRASVFAKRLRYEKGLVYTVGTYSDSIADGGTWSVITSTSKDKLQEVVNIITEEFTRIAAGKITKEELEFAKNKITKSSKRMMQTSSSWTNRHVYNLLIGRSLKFPDYLNAVNSTTQADLSKVGKKYFKRDSWYLAMCGDISKDAVSVNY